MCWLENSDKKRRRQSYTKKYLARLFHIVPCQVKSQSCQNFQIKNQSTLKKLHSCFLDSCFCSRLAQRKNRSSMRKSIQNNFSFQLWNIFYCVSRNLIDVAEVFFKSKFNIVHLQCWLGTPKDKPLWIFVRWHWYLCIIGRWKAFNFFWNYFLVINPAFKAKKITQMLL